MELLSKAVRDDLSIDEARDALVASANYLKQRPDSDVEEKLRRIDWENDELVAFLGKLIGFKGAPALVG